MGPAHQGFERDDFTRQGIHDRLKGKAEIEAALDLGQQMLPAAIEVFVGFETGFYGTLASLVQCKDLWRGLDEPSPYVSYPYTLKTKNLKTPF